RRSSALATDADRLAYVRRLFDYVDGRRMWSRKRKAGFVRGAVDEMETKPQHLWRRLKEGSDENERMMLAAVSKGVETKDEIVAETGLNPITVQNYLSSLYGSGDIDRIGFGRYTMAGKGLGRHVPPGQAVLDAVDTGAETPAEIRAHTGLPKEKVAS